MYSAVVSEDRNAYNQVNTWYSHSVFNYGLLQGESKRTHQNKLCSHFKNSFYTLTLNGRPCKKRLQNLPVNAKGKEANLTV